MGQTNFVKHRFMAYSRDLLIRLCIKSGAKEGEKVSYEMTDCCKGDILFTQNSGVYVTPGLFCSKCHRLLMEK